MCGIFAVTSKKPIIGKTILGLYDLQHRGEQGVGAIFSDGKKVIEERGLGSVPSVFREEVREELIGEMPNSCLGMGQTLYSTRDIEGNGQSKTVQPLIGRFQGHRFAFGFNGNITNVPELRASVPKYKFLSKESDAETIVALIEKSKKKDFLESLLDVLPKLKGAFSMTFLYQGKAIGVRDGNGIRPLCIGRDPNSIMIASESCAFSSEGGYLIRDVFPGEIVVLGPNRIEKSFLWAKNPRLSICMTEFIYFARPESKIDGCSVHLFRYIAGSILAEEHPAVAEMVFPIPDSGKIYDQGYSQKLEIPIRTGVSRNRYVAGRTFLADRNVNRRELQRIKLHPVREVVCGQRAVVTDDSIFRCNVSTEVNTMLKGVGAKEIHLRIGSAPIKYPCCLGIDTPTKKELIASSRSVLEIQQLIGCDSLGYLSVEGMTVATGLPKQNLCLGCFTGCYPRKCCTKACI